MDETRAEMWRLFDLAHDNFKSISKAQYFYLSTLLIYLAIVWGWHFTAVSGVVPVQILGIALSTNGLWAITPAVTTALSLGLIGSVNAAGPELKRLKEISQHLDFQVLSGVALYNLDTYKNLFDYFTYLRVNPISHPIAEQGRRFSGWHFLYPSLYAVSIYTSGRAIGEAWGGNLFKSPLALSYAFICVGSQILYSVRPWWRAFGRFWNGKLESD